MTSYWKDSVVEFDLNNIDDALERLRHRGELWLGDTNASPADESWNGQWASLEHFGTTRSVRYLPVPGVVVVSRIDGITSFEVVR